ncbi:MAG: sigma-70 family RNA polymerase sigma factor [Bacteroidetes bacterium]|nr:sigma-70 family RNA polymerase sigma factor [Bacteroidota bacterium]MBS1608287.1 sigma-70 family RNA polymerase sigma factor [Bacteroidota bacterium]
MTSKTTYGEVELVALLQQRNNQAFTYLYDNYSGALYGIINQIVPDRESANDVLQEVFINIWRKIGTYDLSKGRLFTWMLNIARNASIDKIRSKAWQNDLKNQSIPEDVNNLESHLIRPNMDNLGFRKIVGRLREEQRTLIELSYFQGYTHEEIAKGLSIPLGTVKTRIRTALLQLRSMMDQQ